jgi:hypothetical protein
MTFNCRVASWPSGRFGQGLWPHDLISDPQRLFTYSPFFFQLREAP